MEKSCFFMVFFIFFDGLQSEDISFEIQLLIITFFNLQLLKS